MGLNGQQHGFTEIGGDLLDGERPGCLFPQLAQLAQWIITDGQ